jgi:hypothetical protein
MPKHDKSRKAYKNFLLISPALIFLTVMGTGCGRPPYKTTSQGGTNTDLNLTGDNPGGGDNSGGTPGTGIPAQRFTVQGTGYDTHYFTVKTRSVLKVKFIPGRQDRTQSGTGYTWQYSMLGVFIGVGGTTQPTAPLYNGYGGTTAESSTVMDLSSFYTKTCSSSDTACRQSVTITVTQPNNDDNCINRGVCYPQQWSHVPDNHPWNGTLVVQTDDTDAI